jgi:hypothetical protein
MAHRIRGTVGALLATSLLTGCELITGPSDLEELDRARLRWAVNGYDSYSYELLRSCFCGYPAVGERVVVVVHTGLVVSAWLASTGELLPPSTLGSFPTVEDLFDIAEDAVREADRHDLRYDERLGYPYLLDIDWIVNAIDDEITIRAEAVIPIR